VRHIGIVACSAEGAALCYQSIVQQSAATLGADAHPRITLDSIPLATWMPAFQAGDDQGVAAIMLESAQALALAGADFLVCPDNSAHRAWRFLEDSPLPWLHIATVVAERARHLGHRRVGVLGTRFTVEGTVYPDALGAVGIDAVMPGAPDADLVDRVIFAELVRGVVTAESRRALQGVIARLAEDGCDAVALACTEIPLLVRAQDSPLPVLDSTRLLAAAALEAALTP
jgi:aspartate racemase